MNWKLSRPLMWTAVILITVLIMTAGCSKHPSGNNNTLHEKLLHTIRQTCSTIGIDFTAQSGETARDSQIVTLHNVVISVNTSSLKDLRTGTSFKTGTLPLNIKEIVFHYIPADKYLGLIRMKGMAMQWDFDVPSNSENKLMAMGINMSAEDILYDEYDISPLLTSKATTATELVIELFSNANAMKSTTKNMVYELKLAGKNDKEITFSMEFSSVKGSQSMNPDIFLGLYSKKEKSQPDFLKILEHGSPVFDISIDSGPLKLNYLVNGQHKGGGNIDRLAFAYFLKPDDSHKFFTYGMNAEVKHMNASISGNQAISLLSRVKELKADLSVINLSAGFAQAYFELMKKSSEMSGKASPDAIRKTQAAMGMKIFMEFMKSKPGIEFSISPFVHELGELEAHGKFRFSGVSIPSGKAKLKIKDAKNLLNTLKHSEELPSFISDLVVDTLTGLLKFNDDGDGFLVLETREKFPGQFFINGKSIRK